MATMKITLNELRTLVKQIIKEESGERLRKQLHTLVRNEMRLGKRAMNSGAPHHVEEHKNAEEELDFFLINNPSMKDYVEDVENHFIKLLYR
jgi:hypothetical protein